MDNLFFGIYPGADAAAAIVVLAEDLNRNHGLGAKPIGANRVHTTAVEFTKVKGVPDQEIIDKAVAAGATLALRSFDIQFDRVLSFKGRKGNALVLAGGDGVTGAIALHRAIIGALHRKLLKIPPNPGYTPHMTLLYSRQMLAVQHIAPVRWRARELALIYSHAGETRHEILARWPLANEIDTSAPPA